jgi:hypothetical protein
MSGFLQRLVAGARRAEPRLRPFAGSPFAADLPAETHDEAVASGDPPGPGPTRAPRGAGAERVAEIASEEEPGPPVDGTPMARSPATGEPEARAAPTRDNPASEPAPRPVRPDAQAIAAADRPSQQSPPAREARAPSSRSAAAERDDEDGFDSPRRFAPPLLMAREPVSAAPPGPVRREPERRLAEPPPSQDPIEIHIGRIEVIAAAPGPASAAPPVPRRSTSLSDYLRRGDRRPR